MRDLRITYTPRSDATPEGELNALAAVYKVLLDRHAEKNAADQHAQSYKRKEASDEPLMK